MCYALPFYHAGYNHHTNTASCYTFYALTLHTHPHLFSNPNPSDIEDDPDVGGRGRESPYHLPKRYIKDDRSYRPSNPLSASYNGTGFLDSENNRSSLRNRTDKMRRSYQDLHGVVSKSAAMSPKPIKNKSGAYIRRHKTQVHLRDKQLYKTVLQEARILQERIDICVR